MIITGRLYRVRCRVGNTVKPEVLVSVDPGLNEGAQADDAVNQAMLYWAGQEGYNEEPITPLMVGVVQSIT